MNIHLRHLVLTAAFGAAITTSFAQQGGKTALPGHGSKDEVHQRMNDIQLEITRLRDLYGHERQIAGLVVELENLSTSLGGDLPVGYVAPGAQATQLPPAPAVPTTCGGVTPTTSSFAGTNGPITPPTPFMGMTYTTVVSGAGPFLWDVNLNTNITHTFAGDLDITLQSPAGTIVTITTDNGGLNDDVFAGTLWDDNVNAPVTDHAFANLVVATPLSPEGRLAAFRGENPNGTWTLRILDDAGADTGTLNSWSLDVSTLASAPATVTTNLTTSPGLAIGPGVTSTMSSIVAGGLGTNLNEVTLFLELPHLNSADLDITLMSPAGTVVTVTTDNGGTFDNVFSGTLFDPSVLDTVTDHVYANLVVATPLSPEGSFDNFLGQNPNGTWTLTVNDDATGASGGTLVRWDLNITTSAPPSPSAPANFAGMAGPIPDNMPPVFNTTNYTATVSGAASSLWDVDLTTFITHTFPGDLDITLTSPAGTTVTISTDNGGGSDDVFNGTLWDDNANDPVTDHAFTDTVLATPLSPEGRLTAFRGENPNGVWTLAIADDALGDDGMLASWSVGISTVPTAPVFSGPTSFTQSPGLAITAMGAPTVMDTMAVSGIGTNLAKLTLFLEVPHTFGGDLDITLTSPAGTVVTVTTDNGGGNDNVFAGTLFDSDVTDTVTDHVYADLVVATPLSPEGSFDNFVGQDPNGTWTIVISDDANQDGGTFVRWDLNITTCAIGTPCIAFCSGDGSGTACPCGNTGAAGNGCGHSLNAAGANLSCTGLASISSDSFTLLGTGMPNASALYFQGTVRVNGGLGAVFGDGLRCVAGTVNRLGTKLNAGGASAYPVAGDVPISIRGMNVAGNVRDYQCWFRNAAAFCTAATFNLTNGVETTWIP